MKAPSVSDTKTGVKRVPIKLHCIGIVLSFTVLPAFSQTQTTCNQFGDTINCNTYSNNAPQQTVLQPAPAQSFVDGFQRAQLNIAQMRAAKAQADLAEAQADAIRQQTSALEAERQRVADTELQREQAVIRAQDEAQRRTAAEAASTAARERADAKATAALHAERANVSELTATAHDLESRCLTSHDGSTCDAADAYRSELRFRRLTQPTSH